MHSEEVFANPANPMIGVDSAPSAAVAERVNIQANAHKRVARRRPMWIAPAASIALVVLVAANVFVQLNRQYFDKLSDGDWAIQRTEQCESQGKVPDALYLGSSRTLFSTSPHVIDNLVYSDTGRSIRTCNAGLINSSIEQDYYVFKRLVTDGYAPRLLVENLWEDNINIHAQEPVSGDFREQNWAEIQLLANPSDGADMQAHLGSSSAGKLRYVKWLANKLIPVYGDRVGLYNFVCAGHSIGPCGQNTKTGDPNWTWRYSDSDAQGFVPITNGSLANAPAQSATDSAITRFWWLHAELTNFTIGGHQPEYLRKLISLALQHGTKVVLVVSPLHPIFFQSLDRPSDWQMISGYWASVAAQSGAAYHDMSQMPGMTSADFYDPVHLTLSGAEKYSNWLAANVVEPMTA